MNRARLAPLLARADILVEQFRPGVMERLGLGYATVSAANPGLIYCSITGYGQTGPKRHDVGMISTTSAMRVSWHFQWARRSGRSCRRR